MADDGATGVGGARMRSLFNQFEGVTVAPPPAPAPERFASALDAPRAVVSGAAADAREDAAGRVGERVRRASSRGGAAEPPAAAPLGAARRRMPPPIGPADSDEARALKREIVAREAEIQDMAGRLAALAENLDRIAALFVAAQVGAPGVGGGGVYVPPPIGAAASDTASMSDPARRSAARGPRPATAGPLESRGATAGTSPPSASGAVGSSLEEILAAARSGRPSSRARSETPKYASLLK